MLSEEMVSKYHECFERGRIKLAAALRCTTRVISGAVQYANERIQFNTAIAQFGAVLN
jgi:alkylation response protein AidB-like acyl-CoA dehydrogenase